jgi:preprotein translocase subunit SecA
MELLEQIWERTGTAVNGVLSGIERGLTGLFGTSNARLIKRMQGQVERINALESQLKQATDDQLRERTHNFRQAFKRGESLEQFLPEAFAVCREAGVRFLGMRHYDVQLIGGMVLHGGNIAEMITGEGKTLVATLPAYLNAVSGRGVHVVTVNDYLARRDMEWMGPLYMGLGLSVGNIQSGMDNAAKQKAYACDITYGTNNEFGFDYLRDNMRLAGRGDMRFPGEYQQVQGPLNYAIIDEVDNILIDEARTPLIISGPAHQDARLYAAADAIARQLRREEHFTVNEKDRTVGLNDDGVRTAERLAGVESFYTAGNMEWPHLIDNALKARYLFQRDVNYVVKDGTIVIVDEFTGRLMEGRQWSDGLHQAVEAKEGVPIKEETQTLATITLQNFFKLYNKLAGMTGTAMTEANEFWKIYGLDVVAVPSNRNLQRIEHPDTIFLTEQEKFDAIADDVDLTHSYDRLTIKGGAAITGKVLEELPDRLKVRNADTQELSEVPRESVEHWQPRGRPILIGTVTIEKSEQLSQLLERRGIPHQVLNAKQHKREAEIIAQAGRMGAVTIATNMAGRGTDIILGGNAETLAWAQLQDQYPTRLEVPREVWDELVDRIEAEQNMRPEGELVRSIGGLYVIGTERHESRRIDLQLRGRCGRQGDPGSSRFYLSLEDDLMRIFAGDWVRAMMGKMGMGNGEALESRFVSRRISAAQKKVEERNFEIRKNLLEYDEVMDYQRKRVYGFRQQILDGVSCRDLILEQTHQQIRHYANQFADPMYGPECYARWAGGRLGCQLDPRDFRTTDAETAAYHAKDTAERKAELQVIEAIDENLPAEEEQSEWNWETLASWASSRFDAQIRGLDLKKLERDDVEELLSRKAREHIQGIDLSEGASFLAEDYGPQMLASWAKNRFGVQIDLVRVKELDAKQMTDYLQQVIEQAYGQRQAEFPAMYGLSRFREQVAANSFQLRRQELAQWAEQRFPKYRIGELEGLSTDEIHHRLLEASEQQASEGVTIRQEAMAQIARLFGDKPADLTPRQFPQGAERAEAFVGWLKEHLRYQGDAEPWLDMKREKIEHSLIQVLDDMFHPEIRRMERSLLLSFVDASWKDHLLAMDHLRSAVSLKGYAQMDPKVEYKREGMKLFDQMWLSIGERVTEFVFRMEGLPEDVVGRTWVESAARHDPAEAPADLARQQLRDLKAAEKAGAPSPEEVVIERLRRDPKSVGRNDPCPCGSGRKYKACCLRKE